MCMNQRLKLGLLTRVRARPYLQEHGHLTSAYTTEENASFSLPAIINRLEVLGKGRGPESPSPLCKSPVGH